MRISIATAGLLLAVLFPPGIGGAQSASYPPYTRPVTTYVPPRTADGQPDISGLYLGIPLPRGIETPLAPSTRYAWTVRARFDLDGATRVTAWGSEGRGSRLPQVPNPFYYRFAIP